MIKVYQFDENMAIIKWEGLEDMTLLAKLIRTHEKEIKIKTINKELKE